MTTSATRALLVLAALLLAMPGCGGGDDGKVPVPGQEGRLKTAAADRAVRRAYDGSPPTIPHEPMGVPCMQCHTMQGLAVDGVGYAPAMPHDETLGLGAASRCEQCHVFTVDDAVFVENDFAGVPQDLRSGQVLYEGAPPVIPHRVFMRENCAACHTGPAAREEIRTPHPDRVRCRQCHVEAVTQSVFPL